LKWIKSKLMLRNSFRIGLGILIIGSALFCILPTNSGLIRSGANYTVHIMFANLALGLFCLMINEKQLLFLSFLSCAGLCLHLKNSSNNVLKLPTKTVQEVLNIGQINIASTHEHIFETISSIKNTDVDMLSVQEITPDMAMLLKQELKSLYPHHIIVHRKKDFIGTGIFSKQPFLSVDTFYLEDIPNLSVNVKCANQDVAIISSFVYPELSIADNPKVLAHFEKIKDYTNSKSFPTIAIGDFNQLQFSNYLKDFKRQASLNDSRRFQFFDNPTDHIFFSSHFDCVEFQTISNRYTNHLGIKGSYQLNNTAANVKSSNIKF